MLPANVYWLVLLIGGCVGKKCLVKESLWLCCCVLPQQKVANKLYLFNFNFS